MAAKTGSNPPSAPPPEAPGDQKTADEFIAEKHIGERIRRLRLKKSMGLVELGKHTGLSASFLSQLETGRVVPTLRNLARIAMVFSKDLSYFFEPEARTLFRVHKVKDRVRLPQQDAQMPAFFFESLGYQVPDRVVDPYWAEFPATKPGMNVKQHSHPGYEWVYVLDGVLEISHGDSIEQLHPGDAVYFDSTTLHTYRNAGKSTTRAIIVTSPYPNSPMPGTTAPTNRVLGPHSPNLAAPQGASPQKPSQKGPPWLPIKKDK
jgi:transcriptional regulator with XRE-family HTH domain